MSVKIDMELPKGCHSCPFSEHSGYYDGWCIASSKVKVNVFADEFENKRPEDCPMREVK